jgi:hypothetical protein
MPSSRQKGGRAVPDTHRGKKQSQWTLEDWKNETVLLNNEVEEWQTASGLVGGTGDPGSVTPKMAEEYVHGLKRVAELADRLTDKNGRLFKGFIGNFPVQNDVFRDLSGGGDRPGYKAFLDRETFDRLREAIAALPPDSDA